MSEKNLTEKILYLNKVEGLNLYNLYLGVDDIFHVTLRPKGFWVNVNGEGKTIGEALNVAIENASHFRKEHPKVENKKRKKRRRLSA